RIDENFADQRDIMQRRGEHHAVPESVQCIEGQADYEPDANVLNAAVDQRFLILSLQWCRRKTQRQPVAWLLLQRAHLAYRALKTHATSASARSASLRSEERR